MINMCVSMCVCYRNYKILLFRISFQWTEQDGKKYKDFDAKMYIVWL